MDEFIEDIAPSTPAMGSGVRFAPNIGWTDVPRSIANEEEVAVPLQQEDDEESRSSYMLWV